jgi:two-component system, OmpR family, phosphate regulon sensor histidine kinase PhoR
LIRALIQVIASLGRRQYSLRAKLILATALVALPGILLVLVGDTIVLAQRRAEVPRSDLAITNSVGVLIDASFDEAVAVGWAIANAPSTQSFDPAVLDPMLQRLEPNYRQFDNVGVFDAQGRSVGEMLPYPPGAARQSAAGRPFFQAVMRANGPVVSGVELSPRTGRSVAYVAVPVRDPAGQPAGAVAVAVSLQALRDRISQIPLALGQVIVVTDPTGRLALATNQLNTSSAVPSLADTPLIRQAMSGTSATQESGPFPPLSGSWLGAAHASPRHHWIVAVIEPPGGAAQAVSRAVWLDLASLVLALALSAAVALFVSGRILGPVRALDRAAHAWSHGELDERVVIHSHDELEMLGNTFDTMAASLSDTLQRLTDTDRRLIEERNRLRAIVDTSPVGILVMTRDEHIALANPAAEALLGQTMSRSVPASSYSIVPRLFRTDGTPYPYDDLPIVRALRHGATIVGSEVVLRRPNGRENRFLVNAAPIREPDGTVVGSVAIFFDVTPLAEEQRLRTEFVVSAAQEFRNPLTVIKGYAEMAMRDASIRGTNVYRELERIVAAANRLGSLADDLVRSAQLHLPPLVLRHELVDLDRLAEYAVREFQAANLQPSQRIVVETKPAQVNGDATLLAEAITNLLRQATAATPSGGEIAVRVWTWDGIATVAVTDHGPVVSPDKIPALFRPFSIPGHEEQNGVATRPSLPLYLAKRIVEESGGWIRAQSSTGGTTISLTLPRHAAGSGVPATAPSAAATAKGVPAEEAVAGRRTPGLGGT